jgi:hypothetical protein
MYKISKTNKEGDLFVFLSDSISILSQRSTEMIGRGYIVDHQAGVITISSGLRWEKYVYEYVVF